MINSPSRFNQWKNKADTVDTLYFNNTTNPTVQFDIDISDPLACVDFVFSGRLLNGAGGGVDPVATQDALLRCFTVQAWIEKEGGNIDLIQAGTPLYQVYYLMQRVLARQNQNGAPGGFAQQNVNPLYPHNYNNVIGVAANPTEDFALHFPFYFGYLGGGNIEYQAGLLMPRADIRALKFQFTCVVNNSASAVLSKDYPFPTSTLAYTFGGWGGSGNASIQAFITKVDINTVNKEIAGALLPVIRTKPLMSGSGVFGVPSGGGVLNGLVMDKFDRGLFWQGIALFEQQVTTATGLTVNRAKISKQANLSTILRDITLSANSQRLQEWNNFLECLRENTQQGDAALSISEIRSIPSYLTIAKLGSLDGLMDLRRYFKENDNIQIQFDNVQDPTTASVVDYIQAAIYAYQDISVPTVSPAK